jgi:hypothetical protein
METSSSNGAQGIRLAERQRIDQVCDRFESALKLGAHPAIEEFLGESPDPLRTELLTELLPLDIYYRHHAGEQPLAANYLARFPSLDEGWLANALAAAGPRNRVAAPANAGGGGGRRPEDYEIVGEIGRGGMGTVLRARDPAFDREVAIKVLREQHAHRPMSRSCSKKSPSTDRDVSAPSVGNALHGVGDSAWRECFAFAPTGT